MVPGIYQDTRDKDYCYFQEGIKSPWVFGNEPFMCMLVDLYESDYFKTSPHYLVFNLPSEFLYGEDYKS